TLVAKRVKMEAGNAQRSAVREQELTQLYQQALSSYKNNDTKGAIDKYLKLSSLYEKTGESSKQADVLSQIAAIMLSNERKTSTPKPIKTLEYYNAARSLYHRAKNLREEAATL